MTKPLASNTHFRSQNQSAVVTFQPEFTYQARVFDPSTNEFVPLQLQRNDSGDAVHFSIDRLSFSCSLTDVQTVGGASGSSRLSITEFRGTVYGDLDREEPITIVVNCGTEPESLSISAEAFGMPEQLFLQITHDIQTGVIDFLTGCVKQASRQIAM